MTILAIETTGVVCGVCLMKDGEPIGIIETDTPNIHDVQLQQATKELMRQTQCSFDDVDVVAVSAGPGSFTGTRIGVSFAKGLTFSNSPKLLGISTLESLACGSAQTFFKGEHFHLAVIIPSHRDQVFMQRFHVHGVSDYHASSEILNVESSKIRDHAGKSDIIVSTTHSEFVQLSPSSAFVARTAFVLFMHGTAVLADPLTFVPEYRQEFVGRPKSE